MKVRWANSIAGFNMPIKATLNGETHWLTPTTKWSNVEVKQTNVNVVIDANFYVSVLNILGN